MCRLSFTQARALGIDERIIRAAEEHGERHSPELVEKARKLSGRLREDLVLSEGPVKRKRSKPDDGMNKTERAFSEVLDAAARRGDILNWWREPFKVQLAGRTWYTPDFAVETMKRHVVMIEVKGFMRDDAAVKLKVAAMKYPCFLWLIVRREGRHGWDVREVTRTGIGTAPITVGWIGGGGE